MNPSDKQDASLQPMADTFSRLWEATCVLLSIWLYKPKAACIFLGISMCLGILFALAEADLHHLQTEIPDNE